MKDTMNDPERLSASGTDEQRALLRSAHTVAAPDQVKDRVHRALEERLGFPGAAGGANARRPRRVTIALGAAGLLVAATAAAAQGLGGFDRLWNTLTGGGEQPPPVESRPAPAPAREAPPTAPEPAPIVPAVERAAPAPRPTTAAPSAAPGSVGEPAAPLPIRRPALDLSAFRRGVDDQPPPPPPAAARAPAPLVITRAGRAPVLLEAGASTLRGSVRGRAVDLQFTATSITGRIGGDAVLLRVFGNRRAEGTVGGRELGFVFNPTRQGWIVGAALPDVEARVELDPSRLSFLPGCDRPLSAASGHPGRYQGTCADGAAVRVDLPPAFLGIPPLIRMVVLGMLLPERDPILPEDTPGLFPPGAR